MGGWERGTLDHLWHQFRAILEPFGLHFGAILESKFSDLGVLGAPGECLGAMLAPMAAQGAPSGRNRGSWLTLGLPIGKPFSAFLEIFDSFFGDLICSHFFEGSRAPF